ncbi:MAG: PAS domain-containing protein [Endomicrobium sp.]|jgi:PAS domain S-box-containing protein|nr:PAS domain-containing protein [Endomicrobium sp.]
MSKEELVIDNILQSVPGCIYWKDVNGVYLGCNQKEAETLGFKYPKGVVGTTDYDLSWNCEADVLRKTAERVMHNRVSEEVLEKVTSSNDEKILALTRKSPLYDGKDNVVGVIGVSIDITDRKKREEAKTKLKIREGLRKIAKEKEE